MICSCRAVCKCTQAFPRAVAQVMLYFGEECSCPFLSPGYATGIFIGVQIAHKRQVAVFGVGYALVRRKILDCVERIT